MQVAAILAGIVRERRAENRGHCGQQVDVAHGLVAGRAGLDLAGPARDERHAVASFPQVALCAVQRTHAVMPELLCPIVNAGPHFSGDFGSVVAGEYDERVFGLAGRGYAAMTRPTVSSTWATKSP